MTYGINLHPVLPLRRESAEQTELVTQLLFGEHFAILEETEQWARIRNIADSYIGWADKKMITTIDEATASQLENGADARFVKSRWTECTNTAGETVVLPLGSRLPFFDKKQSIFGLINNRFRISKPETSLAKNPIDVARLFLNAPYLWGGKTIFGIDCSGLTQLAFSLSDVLLPRDACLQAECGELVDSLQDVRKGDLAFFSNERGRIVHVGILLDEAQIIHASGKVRIDRIDKQGILADSDSYRDKYTHTLHSFRRIKI